MLSGALVFALASLAVWQMLSRLWPDAGVRRLPGAGPARQVRARWTERLSPRWLHALAWLSRWSLPQDKTKQPGAGKGTRQSALQLQLVQAGWRSRHALWLFGAARTGLMLLLPVLLAPLAWWAGIASGSLLWWTGLLGAAALGLRLPDAALRFQCRRRKEQLFRAFPDALDLMRICVQAGLGLDAAIDRVGREMRLSSPALAEEWQLTGLELRAGASRSLALRHLARRVGLAEVQSLVTMLVQADRFGTRMADALQVQADSLRTQRRLRAEEAAAKLPVKLLMPLVFCIFPALLTVLLGPVGISLYRHLVETAA